MENYSLDGLEERADRARQAHAGYVEGLMLAYKERRVWREARGLPAIGVCGHGRAGKDTSAEYICARLGAKYPNSASWQMLPMVAHMVGIDRQAAWDTRHQHREFWINACHALRSYDYSMLVRMCLGAGDIAVGIRGRLELEACLREGVLDFALWVDNPRVQPDVTVEYGMADCDFTIVNSGSLMSLYGRLDKMLHLLKLRGPAADKRKGE
jgi:hypothetical protein